MTGDDPEEGATPEDQIDILTGITSRLVERGMSVHAIDRTEFESLWEYLIYNAPTSSAGYIDEVI